MMRAGTWAWLLVAAALAGCSDDPATTAVGGSPAQDGEVPPAPTPLRFVAADRPPAEMDLTVTVSPQDACLPASCAMYSATGGGGDPAFLKSIDITSVLPPGMHALVEMDASWEKTNPVTLVDRMNLQWWGRDTWVSGYQSSTDTGQARLEAYLTHLGPDPPEAILVVLEPEGLHEEVEVAVHVRVTPLDDALHRSHVAAARLEGGAVPVTVRVNGTDTVLHVRGPDDAPVLTEAVADGATVTLPAGSPRGEYLFVFFGNDEPARLLVPAANLTSPLLRAIDTSAAFGSPRPMPSGDEVSWTVDLATPPYWVGLALDALDGRSTTLEGGQVTITAPDGTRVASESFDCQGCLYSLRTTGGDLADPAYTAGTYTFSVSSELAQGWQVYEVVSLYGR